MMTSLVEMITSINTCGFRDSFQCWESVILIPSATNDPETSLTSNIATSHWLTSVRSCNIELDS